MINELRKNVYTEADHQDLARHLNLLHFYAEITKLEFVGFKEIPEVCRSLKYFLERNIFAVRNIFWAKIFSGIAAEVGRGQRADGG